MQKYSRIKYKFKKKIIKNNTLPKHFIRANFLVDKQVRFQKSIKMKM